MTLAVPEAWAGTRCEAACLGIRPTAPPANGQRANQQNTRDMARDEIELVEMGESRTPRPEPLTGNHYERVRWFVVDRPDEHRHPAGRSSHVSLDRACHRITQRSSGLQPRLMTLPPPAGPRWLPRSH